MLRIFKLFDMKIDFEQKWARRKHSCGLGYPRLTDVICFPILGIYSSMSKCTSSRRVVLCSGFVCDYLMDFVHLGFYQFAIGQRQSLSR